VSTSAPKGSPTTDTRSFAREPRGKHPSSTDDSKSHRAEAVPRAPPAAAAAGPGDARFRGALDHGSFALYPTREAGPTRWGMERWGGLCPPTGQPFPGPRALAVLTVPRPEPSLARDWVPRPGAVCRGLASRVWPPRVGGEPADTRCVVSVVRGQGRLGWLAALTLACGWAASRRRPWGMLASGGVCSLRTCRYDDLCGRRREGGGGGVVGQQYAFGFERKGRACVCGVAPPPSTPHPPPCVLQIMCRFGCVSCCGHGFGARACVCVFSPTSELRTLPGATRCWWGHPQTPTLTARPACRCAVKSPPQAVSFACGTCGAIGAGLAPGKRCAVVAAEAGMPPPPLPSCPPPPGVPRCATVQLTPPGC
jgi:hypothetical protein